MYANIGSLSPRFSGHETFTLRYGWLKKAVDATSENRLIFQNDDALVTLGVGKNMVRSIRYWGLATGILEEDTEVANNRGRSVRPSKLGKALFGAHGLDPYLEEPGTLWLLHWQLVSNSEGPTTWYWAFNHFTEVEFTKDKLVHELEGLAGQHDWKRVANTSLRRDVDCFLRTYVASHATRMLVLEDTLDCPLVELGLIQELESGRIYSFTRGEHPTLPFGVFAYALLQYWKAAAPQRQAITFDEIAYGPSSPGRVFKLSEDALTEYLEALEDGTDNAVSYNTSAGLRQLYRRESCDALSILRRHYPKRSRSQA